MINRYVWDLYKNSGGNQTIELFRKNLNGIISDDFINTVRNLHAGYCVDKAMVEHIYEQLCTLRDNMINDPPEKDSYDEEDDYSTEEELLSIFDEMYSEWEIDATDDKAIFDWFHRNIAEISTEFAFEFPGIFIPYYFTSNYNVINLISEAFDIQLPEVPKKSDYKGRTRHYANLCAVLNDFRKENDFSMSELCAFLYDFAPKYIGGVNSYIIDDLPEPRSAYFIGGGGDNDDATAEDDSDSVFGWQCNPGTRAGDMIVMYLRTLISAISSIWRSKSVGFIDPLSWYYRRTFIGDPIEVERIDLSEIRRDSVLGEMPIVAKNMQGINGVELKPSEYNHIIDITKADAPKLEYVMDGNPGSCINEKEVEERLIKPMLNRLGYREDEYEQQHRVEVGNHNVTLIPDFVLSPVSSKGHYSGYATIEAKRSITNEKQMEETKVQARSYAKMVGAKYSVIASQEGIWITEASDDYTKEVFSAKWDDLIDGDVFYTLSQMLGNKK